jgi:hypothetical protein
MRTLAALMLSMLVLTTALFTHALTHQESSTQPAPVAGGMADGHGRQLAVIRGR